MTRAVWIVAAIIAVWWPARFIGPLDGAPLDRPLEAMLLGLALPWLLWVGRDAMRSKAWRAAVVALLVWKAGTFLIASQQGLCATFQSPQPLDGTVQTIRISEPEGWLRSWDVRADLWAASPRCTAILTRVLPTGRDFPAWFVNITGVMQPGGEVMMNAHGVVSGRDGVSHPVSYSTTLRGEPWSFDPQLDGGSIWRAPLVTTSEPSAVDRFFAPWAWVVSPLLGALIVGFLLRASLALLSTERSGAVWLVAGSLAAIACGLSASSGVQRAAGALAFGAVLTRWPARSDAVRYAALVIGVPWLVFFATVSLAQVGRLTPYSIDDWLTYQVAGYRIFMNGYWLEAGTAAFDYQALYRWISGALHLVFGDSSVGEMYWDASWLLIGALLAFHIVREVAAGKWAVVAAALTLVTFTVATPWYIIGRGLSEITAAGLGFLAMASLLRSDGTRAGWIVAAAALAGLMFYARQNQLLWAPVLVAMVIPLTVGSDIASVRAAVSRIRWSPVMLYLGTFTAAVLAYMARTFYFTGHFALFYGSSLRHNDTNLRPWTIFNADVWSKVGHSLMGLVFMNEPPRVDPRAAVMVAGAIVAILALVQMPIARRIPAALTLVTAGGVLGAFVAHSHGYPGRFTIHLVPLAAALSVIAVAPTAR
jgi:hypothetical protein